VRNILIIWAKELRDTVRDRRTLMVMVLVPILLTPALIVGMNALVHATSSKPVHIAVSGSASACGAAATPTARNRDRQRQPGRGRQAGQRRRRSRHRGGLRFAR